MKLLEILGIQKTKFATDGELLNDIKKAYKKLAPKYHPDTNGGDEKLTEKFKMISTIYQVLTDLKYRQYYISNYPQIDVHFNEDQFDDFLKKYIKEQIVDVSKTNANVAQQIYSALFINFSYNLLGLDNVQKAIDSIKLPSTGNPFYQYTGSLSQEAKDRCLAFFEGQQEDIITVIKRARLVFAQQNIQPNQKGLMIISTLMDQLSQNNHSGVPKELFADVDDAKHQNYIVAYYDVLNQNKNWIEFLYQRAHDVISQQHFSDTQQGLVAINSLINEINEGNYGSIPPSLFQNITEENSKLSVTGAYLDCLNQRKNYIEFLYQTVHHVISQQNFPCTQQGLVIINSQINQINVGDYGSIPPSLFEEHSKSSVIGAYLDCLNQHKNYIEALFQKALDVINQQNFQCDRQSLAIITHLIPKLSSGNYSNVPRQLMEDLDENQRRDVTFAYLDILNQYKNYIEFTYQRAQGVIYYQNFQCNQQGLEAITNLVIQLSQKDYSCVPEALFNNINEDQKENIIFAYYDLLNQHKNELEQQHLEEQLKAQLEQQRLAEEQSKAQEEKQRLADEQRKAQEEKQRLADEQRKAQEEKQRLADEQRKAQEEKQRLADEQRKAQEEKQRLADEQRKAQEEKQRLADEQRKAQEEKQRLADEQRKAQEEKQRLADEQRKAQEEKQRLADEQRKAQEKQRPSEEQRKAQEEKQRIAEEQRKAQKEKQRIADEQNKAQEEKQRIDDEQRRAKLEQQRVQTRQNIISSEKQRINKILGDLTQEIGGIDQHHFKEAQNAAECLLIALEDAKISYLASLNNLDMNIDEAAKDFKLACQTAIEETRPVLERDLGWGTYLTNLLKTIANVIIQVVSFGQASNFFKQERAESIKLVEEVDRQLFTL
ncbi:J domain-containing protein [Legionella fallonii]|uniref:J domain-containing protein n=1 Tax=Legionella fallonii LLAP-10 TaxID=1212491 RepID=A0A098G3D2_9GAMM|nr:DnaJ domain-containing protein [Legionella fallonii]CEG56486.1 protein of unknown function [Legionella fallonii LLAP-10]